MFGMKFGGVAFPKLKFQDYVLRIFPVILVENLNIFVSLQCRYPLVLLLVQNITDSNYYIFFSKQQNYFILKHKNYVKNKTF